MSETRIPMEATGTLIPSAENTAACIAYLSARGYVCLKEHTEPPKEKGNYVLVYDSNYGTEVDAGRENYVMDCMKAIKSRGWPCYALGPIKGEG